MDAKITKLRLGRMLSYDWLKIVISTAALIIAWLFLFTVTGTEITPTQKFTVMNYVGNVGLTDGDFYDVNQAALDGDVFSYEVIETSVVELADNADMAGQLLQARTTMEEGDVIFAADDYDYRDVEQREIENDGDNGDTQYEYRFGDTYLQNFLQGYFYQVYDVNVYLEDMRAYLGEYYENGDYTNPLALNEQKVKDDFNARTKKDKRFKKAAARAQAEKDEIERIKKYRNALIKFDWYLENGVVALSETLVQEGYFTDGSDLKGVYSINMCPTLDKGGMTVNDKPAMSGLMNVFSYNPLVLNEEGVLTYGEATANNMNVCMFKFSGVGSGFQYESLSYIVYLIDEYVHADMRCPELVYV